MDDIVEFLLYLQQEANVKRETAGLSGGFGDGGAGHLEEQIQVYRAGTSNRIPDTWTAMYKQFINGRDPEFTKYLELKAKFES